MRLGALVAVIVLALAPAAPAACAARCVAIHPHASTSTAANAGALPAPKAAPMTASDHAHHHAGGVDAQPQRMPPPAAATARSGVGSTPRCAPATGRGCGKVRDALAAPAARAGHDPVPIVTTPRPAAIAVAPQPLGWSPRSRPIRPPGSASAPLPLRI